MDDCDANNSICRLISDRYVEAVADERLKTSTLTNFNKRPTRITAQLK